MKRFGLIVLIAALSCACEQASWPMKAFDSQRWKRSAEESRYVFARDLVDSKILIGKSATAVRDLLGAPSSTIREGRRMAYVVKIGGSGFNQVYSVDVILNSSGVVEKVIILGD